MALWREEKGREGAWREEESPAADEEERAASRAPPAAAAPSPFPSALLSSALRRLDRHELLPFLAAFLLTLAALSALRLATSDAAGRPAFLGEEIAIQAAHNGRYLEVGPDGWLYASSFSHNRHACRFLVEPAPPELVASLLATREFRDAGAASARGRWDLRAAAVDAAAGGGGAFAAPLEAEAAEAAEAAAAAAAAWPAGAPLVLLKSAYAGGYVEVASRAEGDEFVVRVGGGGRLSYRSLFALTPRSVWSLAVRGYLNFRGPTESDPKQHVRAHGNAEPWLPLRALAPSARLHLAAKPAVVDAVGAMRCANLVPAFEWALLLDAARAGRCNGTSLETLRHASAALEALEQSLGPELSHDLPDLVSAYRRVLLDPLWENTLDLQLTKCDERSPSAGPVTTSTPFSTLDGATLSVDLERCPNAAFSEVTLPRHADEPMGLDLSFFSQSGAPSNVTTVSSDAVYVVCNHNADEAPLDRVEQEGEDPTPTAPKTFMETNLWLRLSPTTQTVRTAARARRKGTSERAASPPPPSNKPPPLSVLLLIVDAMSLAHFTRMLPRTLSLFSAQEAAGGIKVYRFEQYSIVGYNSLPNMIPMLSGLDAASFLDTPAASGWRPADELSAAAPTAIWTRFMRRGFATFLAEELHDGCADLSSPAPSSASKLFYSRLGGEAMPHHNLWQAFCQPELRPCCNDPHSFLQPGRRQCVGNGELHRLFLEWVERFWGEYAERDTPRFGLLNLMTAHEHFMTRLRALDDDLRRFFLAIEAHLRRDSALFLLSDHGTHGIWYNDFAVGQAEHRSPALLLLLPVSFVAANPGIDAALRRNRRRRVTAFDLHATLRHLATWPAMPPPSEEATSLFVDLPDDRSCEAARVPPEWCVDLPADCATDGTA